MFINRPVKSRIISINFISYIEPEEHPIFEQAFLRITKSKNFRELECNIWLFDQLACQKDVFAVDMDSILN